MVFCNVYGEILVIFAFLVMRLYILIITILMIIFLQSWSYLPDRQYFDCTLSNRKVNAVYEVVSNVRIEIIWKVNFLIVHSIIFFNILIIFAMLIFLGVCIKCDNDDICEVEIIWKANGRGQQVRRSLHTGVYRVSKKIVICRIHSLSPCCQKTSKLLYKLLYKLLLFPGSWQRLQVSHNSLYQTSWKQAEEIKAICNEFC